MTIRSIPIREGLTLLLRRGFEQQTDSNGRPIADRDGAPVFVAEAVAPGKLLSRYADNDVPTQIRVKVTGTNPGHGDGTVVRLGGKCLLSSWYNARARGAEARSSMTLSAERVDVANGAAPVVRGGIPAFCDVKALYLGQDADGVADLVLEPAAWATVEGVAQVRLAVPQPVDLIGADVQLVDLRAYFVIPDREDVSQRAKAELVLRATTLERTAVANGRARKPEPAPELAAAPTD